MNMKTLRRHALLAALLVAPGLQAAEVADVRVADQLRVGDSELVLNGAGLRSKLFFKVYVGALYAPQKETSAQALIDSTQPRRMRLRLMRDVDADSFYEALDEGMRKNHGAEQLAALKPKIDQLGMLMRAFGKVREGEVIDIDFSPEGVVLTRNGELAGKVAGGEFASALLRVWLGDSPADAGLRKALLGG